MREILFRAKMLTSIRKRDEATGMTHEVIDYNRWACGLLNLIALTNEGPMYEFATFDHGKLMMLGFGATWAYKPDVYFGYDPETVSQYVGFQDKNNKKLFEGDIIRFHAGYLQGHWTGVIEYDNGSFMVKGTIPYRSRSDQDDNFAVPLSNIDKSTIEIIGNKWDNIDILRYSV